ncbi:glycosyltransferase family 4 protein [Collinsella sp. SGI.241]|uniref:glycosyltransferase family 4 protein n=1 Tax=Collinsella sp. SGI.241 TaxID=3420557 RepID=UPI003D06478D
MGGVERYTENLAKKLVELGNEVVVVTSSDSERIGSFISENNVSLIEIPSVSLMNDRFPIIKPIPSTFRAFRHIMELPISDIIINTRYYPICHFACRVAAKKCIRPVLIDHSSGYLSTEKSPMGYLMRLYEGLSTKIISRNKPVACAVSNRSLQWIKSLGFSPHSVIPNSIDAVAYCASASERNWDSELNISPDAFVVAYAGRLIEEKGVMKAIEAINGIHGKNIHLIIAGSGPLNTAISNAQNERIHFVGRLNESDMSSLLRYASCFLMPSEYPEGMPTVLLEAAAQKCAIVVSNCAGASDIIPESNFGTVLQDCAIDSIQKAVLVYFENPNILFEHSHNVHDLVCSRFTWSQTALNLVTNVLDTLSADTN